MSEPPGWTIRRTTVILAASLLLVVVAGVPALAGASIAPAEVEADTDTALTLTVTEPTDEEAEDYGDTARVVLRAPAGFTVLSCGTTPVGWNCTVAEDGTGLTLNRTSPLALADSRDFGFNVHTAGINKQYEFRVTQADGPPAEEGEDPPTTIPSRPVVAVTGGQDPAPEPTAPAGDGGSQDGSTDGDSSGAQDDGGSDGGGTPSTGDPSPAPDADGQDTATGDGDSDDSGSADGSTAPRRTQGRSSGTTLEITPGEPAGDDPAIAPPAVADDATAALPGDGERGGSDTSDSTAAAAAGTQPSDQPDGGAPWQQWVGAALLLAGLATIGVRWFRERRAD